VNNRQKNLFWLRRKFVSEHLAEETVYDGVQPIFDESIPVLLRLPHVDVAEAAFGTFDGEMDDEPLRGHIAETVGDSLVEGGIDRHILSERVCHGKLQP
jgi:hypothetical protein